MSQNGLYLKSQMTLVSDKSEEHCAFSSAPGASWGILKSLRTPAANKYVYLYFLGLPKKTHLSFSIQSYRKTQVKIFINSVTQHFLNSLDRTRNTTETVPEIGEMLSSPCVALVIIFSVECLKQDGNAFAFRPHSVLMHTSFSSQELWNFAFRFYMAVNSSGKADAVGLLSPTVIPLWFHNPIGREGCCQVPWVSVRPYLVERKGSCAHKQNLVSSCLLSLSINFSFLPYSSSKLSFSSLFSTFLPFYLPSTSALANSNTSS